MTQTKLRGQNRRMGVRPILVALCGVSLLFAGCKQQAAADAAAPTSFSDLKGYVNDDAQILTPETKARLSASLKAFEQRTHHQMIVATTPSLGGEDIAVYARALGNRWGIGRKGIDDGLIVLVAPTERKVRIAVGDGLTGQLPDERSRTIIDQDMLPSFKAGDFGTGVEKGVAAISDQIH